MARKTTINNSPGKLDATHGHLYEENASGEIVRGWCLGDEPWRAGYPYPLADDEGHLIMGRHADCEHPGQHDPVKIR
jgi:hypothetical protein